MGGITRLTISTLRSFFDRVLIGGLSLDVDITNSSTTSATVGCNGCYTIICPTMNAVIHIMGYGNCKISVGPGFSRGTRARVGFSFTTKVFTFQLVNLTIGRKVGKVGLLTRIGGS